MALYNYQVPLAPGLNFVKNSLTYFYSLFISSSALHLIAERLASVTADTSFISLWFDPTENRTHTKMIPNKKIKIQKQQQNYLPVLEKVLADSTTQ